MNPPDQATAAAVAATGTPSSVPQHTRTEQRGRKRNDDLPPSRAREVQRAFRARRAAHLSALEDRVKEVELENAELREQLNLPPANRVSFSVLLGLFLPSSSKPFFPSVARLSMVGFVPHIARAWLILTLAE